LSEKWRPEGPEESRAIGFRLSSRLYAVGQLLSLLVVIGAHFKRGISRRPVRLLAQGQRSQVILRDGYACHRSQEPEYGWPRVEGVQSCRLFPLFPAPFPSFLRIISQVVLLALAYPCALAPYILNS
jgi:hypothetical protein